MVLNPNPRIELISLGEVDLLLVDDLLQDPSALREYGIKSHAAYLNKQGAENFRQIETQKTYELHPRPMLFEQAFPGLCAGIAHLVNAHLGERIREFYNVPASVHTLSLRKGPYFHAVHQSPIFLPHVDDGHISSFLYLNPPEQCWGGTGIYRHIPSGKITSNQLGAGLDWLCQNPLSEPLTESTQEWKLEYKIEMKFNRFAAFNSSTMHKIFWPDAQAPYRKDMANARLTLNNFFKYAD